jgi:TPR repeat protein
MCFLKEKNKSGKNRIKKLHKLSKKAADQNNPMGLYLLGGCYRSGLGVEKILEKARDV